MAFYSRSSRRRHLLLLLRLKIVTENEETDGFKSEKSNYIVEQRLPLNGRNISRFLLTGIILAKVIDSCQTHENNPGNQNNPDYIQDSKIMDKTSKDWWTNLQELFHNNYRKLVFPIFVILGMSHFIIDCACNYICLIWLFWIMERFFWFDFLVKTKLPN